VLSMSGAVREEGSEPDPTVADVSMGEAVSADPGTGEHDLFWPISWLPQC